jgi:hypothetical protein
VPQGHGFAGVAGIEVGVRKTSFYLGVFWRRERNWVEMLSRGLK